MGNMKAKPKMCEIVGTEPFQRYTFPDGVNGPYYVDESGHNRDRFGNSLSDEEFPYWEIAINHGMVRAVPEYTEAEKEVMRHMQAVGYRYIVRDFSVIVFSTGKPERNGMSWSGLGRSALATEDISAQFPAITDKSDPVSIEEALA